MMRMLLVMRIKGRSFCGLNYYYFFLVPFVIFFFIICLEVKVDLLRRSRQSEMRELKGAQLAE